jgi:hypothetical protein
MIDSRITESIVNHKGKNLECYIPEIKILDGQWVNVLGENGYILKESFDPVEVCKSCQGSDLKCKNCNGRGTVKGETVNQYSVAEVYLNLAVIKATQGLRYYKK